MASAGAPSPTWSDDDYRDNVNEPLARRDLHLQVGDGWEPLARKFMDEVTGQPAKWAATVRPGFCRSSPEAGRWDAPQAQEGARDGAVDRGLS